MSLGPLQVLIVNFDETNFSGEIEVVRSQAEIAQALLGDGTDEDRELTSDEWAVADAVEPGGAAAIVILEHKWAIPLREAIEGAGGHHVVTEWVAPEALEELGVKLTA